MRSQALTLAVLTMHALCLTWGTPALAQEPETLHLENASLSLQFEPNTGTLNRVGNKLTGETYSIRGDEFAIRAEQFSLRFADFTPVSVQVNGDTLTARYEAQAITAEVAWTLQGEQHFAQKRITLTSAADCGITQIVVSQPEISGEDLELVCYRNPDFEWIADYENAKHGRELRRPAGTEPVQVFFGRTARGGFFSGLEMPFDNAQLERNTLILRYAPNLKIHAGERLACEPLYFGVYRRSGRDANAEQWGPAPPEVVAGQSGTDTASTATAAGPYAIPLVTDAARVRPLPSESAAMVAMTAALLGPPRHGLMAYACGWHSQMQQDAYDSDEELEGDLRSLEFLAACGLDGVTDSHPWGGESDKMGALREGEPYMLDARVRRFVEHARGLGLEVTQWPTMNNTHPWRASGVPFRLDRPEWLRGVEGEALGGTGAGEFQRRKTNCLASGPFYDWLERTIVEEALGTGLYESWCMDGDFWGTGAYFNTTLPVTCLSEDHEHLPGDANYACQRRLNQLNGEVRRRYPGIYIIMCRPPMDLGVWAQRNVDACFTLIESGTGGSNIAGGNEVRTASRIRVHQHFFPHWLDQSLLFPSYGNPKHQPAWPSASIDYLMLSALSSSPNLLLYLPSKTGIPEADRVEIRKWLAWGRENIAYLLVRKDLPDWPAPGKVDGSAHFVGDEGLVFMFNSDSEPLPGEFALTAEGIGLERPGRYRIVQEYPPSERSVTASFGETVHWQVAAQTATVLRVWPLE